METNMQQLWQKFLLNGQAALITGAASGLGVSFAEAMAQAGANVVLVDIDAAGLANTAERMRGFGVRALAVVADVSDEQAVTKAFAQADAEFGRLDILINNAGIGDPEPKQLHEYPTDAWHRVVAINQHGAFYCAREALKRMVPQRRGKIINVASMWGLSGPSSIFPLPAYAATKGAVVNLTRELALQYAPRGININAICPGFFRTRLGPFDDPAFVKAITDYTPAGRIAEPEEIKGTAVYLASAASDFVHGLMLLIDGGCMAK
jgi:NAD(P)-dependent dehydrogenase (short-subunit alcohol dehydrogenase family)